MKSRWTIYLTERFPLLPNALIAAGITLSAMGIAGDPNPGLVPPLMSFVGGMVFLAQIRFMDEYKDFDKDKIAHPLRPLPRGLFTMTEFSRFIRIFNAAMLAVSILAAVLVGKIAGAFFALGALYLYLMFKEFFLGEWLSARPLLYALSHQFIIIPMAAFVLECFSPGSLQHPDFPAFASLLLFSFFGFEVGRKLDPAAHPVLNTYLRRYGREKTAFLLLILLGLSLRAGERLGLLVLLGPIYVLTLVFLSILWWAPKRFKWIEGAVTLFLLLSIWGLPIIRGIR
ncbi:MAG: UbiA family prenyltransferase [Bdellovibrionales bacterium]|nr:UbiA family prenyltransferase [Bdellovibrionales bacterium]